MTSELNTGVPGVAARRVHDLPAALDGASRVGPYSTARPGMLLRTVPGVGRFLARDGSALEYCTEKGADAEAVSALLQGGVLGALIHQRGELPLHATTVVSSDGRQAVALAGASGAGKSTTAFELIRRGWTLLSDDLTRIVVTDGVPVAWPGRSSLRLLSDACERFGTDTGTLSPAPNWAGKYLVELPRWDHPVGLSAMVALERTGGELRVDPLRGAAAARALAEQTYRFHYVAALGQARRHHELIAATAARATVLRACGAAPVPSVADAILAAVDAGRLRRVT